MKKRGKKHLAAAVAWGCLYTLASLVGAAMTGCGMWIAHPVIMPLLVMAVLLAQRPVTAGLVRAGILKPGFYSECRRQVTEIHLAPWTPLNALNGPAQGRITRDNLLRVLSTAVDALSRHATDEVVMASWLLSEQRVRRTLRQAGITTARFDITVAPYHAGRCYRVLLQGQLLLTQWRWPAWDDAGRQVCIRRKTSRPQ